MDEADQLCMTETGLNLINNCRCILSGGKVAFVWMDQPANTKSASEYTAHARLLSSCRITKHHMQAVKLAWHTP